VAPAPPGSLAGLPSGGVAAGLGGPARPAADDSSFSRLFCTLRAMQAAKRKSWFGELWRPLAALLLWAVGIVAAHAAPPLLPSLVETRIGGLTAFPVDCIPAAPLFSSDLTRACGPPLYDSASGCSVAANSGGRIAGLSDRQLLQEIAGRAEAQGIRQGWGAAGTGPVQGTLKHSYAERLLETYQRISGQRGNLVSEQSFLGGVPVPRGTAGSARPDVFDTAGGLIYDYKFVRVPGQGIPAAQQARNAANVPGVTGQIEINP